VRIVFWFIRYINLWGTKPKLICIIKYEDGILIYCSILQFRVYPGGGIEFIELGIIGGGTSKFVGIIGGGTDKSGAEKCLRLYSLLSAVMILIVKHK